MEKILKWILVAFSVIILLAIVWFVSLISAFGVFDKVYSPDDLKASFEEKKIEIYELKHYFNKIVPKNRFVEIEFSSDHELARFGIKALDSKREISLSLCFWNGICQPRQQRWIV